MARDETYFYMALNNVGSLVTTYSITSVNAYFLTDGADSDSTQTGISATALK
jgi:hypothetical protein